MCPDFLSHMINSLWFIRRTKSGSQRRQRPLSEGTPACPGPRKDGRNGGEPGARWAAEADAWGGGRDLPSLLQEVSLKGSRDAGLASSHDAQQMPRRRVNLFLSLRLRKQRASESGGQDQQMQKDIGTLFTNIRNEGNRGCSSHSPGS